MNEDCFDWINLALHSTSYSFFFQGRFKSIIPDIFFILMENGVSAENQIARKLESKSILERKIIFKTNHQQNS